MKTTTDAYGEDAMRAGSIHGVSTAITTAMAADSPFGPAEATSRARAATPAVPADWVVEVE